LADNLLNKYILAAILWSAGILVLTLTPGKSVPDVSLFSYDKLGHAFVFFVHSAFVSKGVFEITGRRLFSIIVTLLISIAYGLSIEVAQYFIPDRGMEWFDAVANILGSFLGIGLFYIINRKKS